MGCGEYVSNEQMLNINNQLWNCFTMPLEITIDCITFVGFIIIFIVFRERTKPRFVQVIWVLLCLCALCNILYIVTRQLSYNLTTVDATKTT